MPCSEPMRSGSYNSPLHASFPILPTFAALRDTSSTSSYSRSFVLFAGNSAPPETLSREPQIDE